MTRRYSRLLVPGGAGVEACWRSLNSDEYRECYKRDHRSPGWSGDGTEPAPGD